MFVLIFLFKNIRHRHIVLQATMVTRQLLSVLVLALCILSVSAQVFISIDCGSSEEYQDENFISWSGDDNYTSAGESRVVGSRNSISRVMDSLRVFNKGRTKNCYEIKVRRGRVLVRVSFYYGNYDNRSTPPTFDLQFDGNHWTTVVTSGTGYVDYEVIYVPKKESISVCVAQTRPGEFPFISALEVRGLETFMYNFYNGTNPLFLMRRRAYGSNSTIRFADDQYDRIWNSVVAPPSATALRDVTSNATFSEATIASDRPPPRVLQHAIAAIRPNGTIQLSTGFTPTLSRIYMNWYFSEVTQLGPNDTRSFQIFLNDEALSDPIEPPFQNCTEWVAWLYDVTNNDTISLVPTNISTLPPLINAMEVFLIGEDDLTNGTNRNDVQGLNSLRDSFEVLEDWTGDPCLPVQFPWDWIQCSNDTEPRVTALLLGGFGLSGALPNFSSMSALRKIDLHNNSLSGPIPDFLGRLPSLTELNLANNSFSGSIPASLSNKTGLNLVVTGNSGLCTSGNSSCSQNPSNSSGTDKLRSHVLKLVVTTIATSIIQLFIMY